MSIMQLDFISRSNPDIPPLAHTTLGPRYRVLRNDPLAVVSFQAIRQPPETPFLSTILVDDTLTSLLLDWSVDPD